MHRVLFNQQIITKRHQSINREVIVRGPGGRDDKGKSAFPQTHCAELGVVGSIPTHGQLAVPWVNLCDLSCVVKNSCGYSVWCCNL